MSTVSPVSKSSRTTQFASQIARIRKEFFSRDARRWPIFADPALADVIHFRSSHLPPDDRLAAYPNGYAEQDELLNDNTVPDVGRPLADVNRRLVFVGALSKCWEDPASVENVITTPCDAAIQGAAIGMFILNTREWQSNWNGLLCGRSPIWLGMTRNARPESLRKVAPFAICTAISSGYAKPCRSRFNWGLSMAKTIA
jgi:hypothetical protein